MTLFHSFYSLILVRSLTQSKVHLNSMTRLFGLLILMYLLINKKITTLTNIDVSEYNKLQNLEIELF